MAAGRRVEVPQVAALTPPPSPSHPASTCLDPPWITRTRQAYFGAMQPGDLVEDFELPDEQGESRTLSGLLADGPVVLFFYPAAMTAGCTKESCHFRDLATEFASVGAQPVGISADSVDKQKQFADTHTFGFPLLSDPDGTVATRFDARRNLKALPTKRKTFVIDSDRRLLSEIKSELRMDLHADRALQLLRQRKAN